MKKAVLALALTLPVWPQTGTVSGPVMGILPAGGGLRSILGVPGAATLGDALPLPFAVTHATAGSRYALAVSAADGSVVRVWADGRSVPLAGVAPGPAALALSPGGRAAGLYHRAARKLEIVTGLPDDADLAATLDLSNLPADPTAWAVDDSGAVLAASGGQLFIARADAPRPVAAIGEVSALAWSGADAVVASAGRLVLVRNVAGEAEISLLAGGETLVRPVAIASANGRFIIADAAQSTLLVVNAAGAGSLACDCAVAGLAPLNTPGLFRVTASDAKPMWLLDTSGGDPRLWFVPNAAEVRQ